jgi:hypothetical protein
LGCCFLYSDEADVPELAGVSVEASVSDEASDSDEAIVSELAGDFE